ncbi:MAG: Fic family protein [Bacilli bacterium]
MSRDPYLYLDCDVLVNKLNIKNAKKLDQFENDTLIAAIANLKAHPMAIKSLYDIKIIHKELFQFVYEWAGEIRKINIYKSEPILNGYSVDYTPCDYIEKELENLEKKFTSINWNSLTIKEKVSKVSSLISELWQIHMFREGNTRSIAMFLYFLLKTLDIHINTEFIGKNAKYFRNALVLSCIYDKSKPEYLLGIIKDTISYKNIQTNSYLSIDGYEVNKYEYKQHTINKLKTIK